MADKMSLQQFGQSIKAKHPEYRDMDDAALGKAVLAKYPQYGDMVSEKPASTDPSGRTPTGEPAAGDTRNGFQRLLDNMVTRDPRKEEWQSPTRNAIDTIARGSGEAILTPLAHPIQTLKGIGSAIAEAHGDPLQLGSALARPMIESAVRDYHESGPAYAGEHLLGSAIGAGATSELAGGLSRSVLPRIGGGIKRTAGAVNDALIGTPSKAMRFGAEPGLQMAKEGIVGSSPASISSEIQSRIPSAAAEHRAIVASAPPNVRINAGPLVTQPFKDAVAGAANPVTGAGGGSAIRSAIRTGRELTNVTDPNTGQLTPSMRNPMISPLEATQLKSNLYGRINYENPSKMALANTGLKGAAHNLKSAVETAVPESIPAGQRLHNLEAAKDVIEPSARSQTLPTSKAGLLDRAVLGTGTRAASGLYGIGSALPAISTPIQAGATSLSLLSPRTQRLIQSLRENDTQ